MDWLIDYYNWRIVSQYTGQFATGLANTCLLYTSDAADE